MAKKAVSRLMRCGAVSTTSGRLTVQLDWLKKLASTLVRECLG